jgi:CubicO group peptidase (beta-lactamase class C family)
VSPRVPRLPIVPDLLRRVRVPRDIESVTTRAAETDPRDAGMTAKSVERIWKDAVSWYRSGVHPAIQVCVRRDGHVILDRAMGHARGNGPADGPDVEKVLATPETPFCVYSASKAITAFVVHKQIERGLIELDAPVCEYIPEYANKGKEAITVGHVLAHRAGVPNLPKEALDLDRMGDREFLCEILCEAKPFARPGRYLAYHAVSGGYILGEVVHRVTGKDMRQLLAEEILDPLGFRWTNYGVVPEDVDRVGRDYVTGMPTPPPLSNLLTRALGASVDQVVEAANDPRFQTGLVPAGNTITTANELSRFYEVMRRGGELDGVRVLEPETIRTALTEQSRLEVDLSLGFPTRFGYGLMLGAQLVSLYGRDTQHAFGHLGFVNILSWADPERALAVAVITSGKPVLYPELGRFYGLMQRITSEAPKVDAGELAF